MSLFRVRSTTKTVELWSSCTPSRSASSTCIVPATPLCWTSDQYHTNLQGTDEKNILLKHDAQTHFLKNGVRCSVRWTARAITVVRPELTNTSPRDRPNGAHQTLRGFEAVLFVDQADSCNAFDKQHVTCHRLPKMIQKQFQISVSFYFPRQIALLASASLITSMPAVTE